MRKLRAFLAVPLPAEVVRQAQAIQRDLRKALPQVRWVRPEAMHLTLKFFGDVPEEALEKIGKVVLSVGSRQAPFQIEVTGLGIFPSLHRPRVIWLGIREDGSLKMLYQSLEEGFAHIGFPAEGRPFTPHLTLGRARERLPAPHEALERYRNHSCGAVPVDQLILFESRLQPAGAVYHPLQTFFLGEKPSPSPIAATGRET